MGKVLLWVVLIVGALLLTRILARHHENSQRRPPLKKAKQKPAPQIQDPEPMVRCAHCSIHLPRSEAVLSGGKTWCSLEHAKLGPRT